MNSNSVIFNAFTIKADRLANKIISDITVSLPHNPNNNESSPTNYHQTKALWDTGATHSVITKKTAEILNLMAKLACLTEFLLLNKSIMSN